MEEKTKTQEHIEFAIPRASVPCVRPSTIDLRKPSMALDFLQRTVTSNLFFSIALVALHLATPLALPLVKLAAVAIHMHGRGQNSHTVQTQFTPSHLFFMSLSGSDANSGADPAHAWATPNHAVSCGDVILVQAGDYSAVDMGNVGAVSSCPSSTGGIDGAGGIYFATILCAGSDLEACTTRGRLWNIGQNNWSVQGWKISFPACASIGCGSEGRAFNLDGSGSPIHHFAIINNICYNVASCVHTDDAGIAGSHGVDYVAAVGNIGVRANYNSSFPEATFDHVGPFPLDTNAGTHAYYYNNYAWNNNGCGTGCNIDAEVFMFDAWNFHAGYNVTGVIANNLSWSGQRYCIHPFGNGSNAITPTMKFYNNTCFHNNENVLTDNTAGELDIAVGLPWTIQVFNNIAYQTLVTSGSSRPIYAATSYGGAQFPSGTNSGLVWGAGVNQNILKGSASTCVGNCDGANNVVAFDANAIPGGIYVNPGFNNTTDLLSNQSPNTPNCSGFVNTTACLGWNANTRVMTIPSAIYDLQPDPNCGSVTGQCLGKGFQLPSTACAVGGDVFTDYPIWLKGVVYLHASGFAAGATIAQNFDLATRKCGL
jgi:hypothetical protein